MRQLLKLVIVFLPIATVGQSLKDHEKAKIYKAGNGQIYTEQNVDSIRYWTNQYVGIRKTKETKDSIYYSINHFDKNQVADKYRAEGYYCGNSKRKSLEEIREKFPYNETHTVRVVSFKGYDSIPKTSGKIDFMKMYEVKTLDKELTDKMLDILVNYDNKSLGMNIAFCWSPRNGIVLLDKNEKVLSYIDICFECQQYYFEPKPAVFGLFCNEKMDAVQGIMKKAGITYGMKRSEN